MINSQKAVKINLKVVRSGGKCQNKPKMWRGGDSYVHEHSIDAKGRAIVPAKYREELGDVFYVTWGVDGCLYLYPQHDWEELARKLQSLPSNQQSRLIQRQLMASASELTLEAG